MVSQIAPTIRRVTVFTPVFNDWACFPTFVSAVNSARKEFCVVTLFLVNDGSSVCCDETLQLVDDGFQGVEILHLACNLGHQRAIAIDLCEAVSREEFDSILVLDVDGEDHPEDAALLFETHWESPQAIVVAQRRNRSELLGLRIIYELYKRLFHVLTGQSLDFGNFSILSAATAERLTYMGELWNHYPATIMRSKAPIKKILIGRCPRYTGDSKMNFVSLMNHGLGAVSVFSDILFARLLILAAAIACLLFTLGGLAVTVRIATSVALPGWATTAMGISFLGLLQVFFLLVVVLFLLLSYRSIVGLPPRAVAREHISHVEKLR